MSNVPHYIHKRKANKLGHENLVDGLLKDGFNDVYNGLHMSNAAELCAKEYNFPTELKP